MDLNRFDGFLAHRATPRHPHTRPAAKDADAIVLIVLIVFLISLAA